MRIGFCHGCGNQTFITPDVPMPYGEVGLCATCEREYHMEAEEVECIEALRAST